MRKEELMDQIKEISILGKTFESSQNLRYVGQSSFIGEGKRDLYRDNKGGSCCK